jgi:hypothetical protein
MENNIKFSIGEVVQVVGLKGNQYYHPTEDRYIKNGDTLKIKFIILNEHCVGYSVVRGEWSGTYHIRLDYIAKFKKNEVEIKFR